MEIRMKNINDYYVGFLNMEHRTDRLQHMTEQLNRIGLSAIRHRGKRPEEITDVPYEKLATMLKRTQGAVGCHFGQVEIMKTALSKDKHAVVFEDDCVFCEDFPARWDYIQRWIKGDCSGDEKCDGKCLDNGSCSLEKQWDVIWLGASFHVNPPYWHRKGGSADIRNNCSANLGYDAKITEDPRMVRTYAAFATFAYLVNKNSIQKILDLFDEHLHKSIGIDWLMCLLQPQLNCFSFVPGCVKQMDSQSDIGDGITRWSGFLQLNGTKENSSYVYQERMEDFSPENFDWKECR